MHTTSRRQTWLPWLILLSAAIEVGATQLTFNIYNDAAKTTWIGNGPFVPQTYGDNVSDFEPTALFGTKYYSYGTNGGLTPNVTVAYRYLNLSNSADNGTPDGQLWDLGYGNLSRVAYPAYGSPYLTEIRLTASLGYRITISNFDIAAFGANVSNQTLKIVRNAGTANASVLWSAGADGAVLVHGGATHDSYTPNVLVADGATISLFYGTSGNTGIDNFTFIESIPEPSALYYAAFTALGALAWKRRR